MLIGLAFAVKEGHIRDVDVILRLAVFGRGDGSDEQQMPNQISIGVHSNSYLMCSRMVEIAVSLIKDVSSKMNMILSGSKLSIN